MSPITHALALAAQYVTVAAFDDAAGYLSSAVVTLSSALDIAKNNAPIHFREGNVAQAMTCLENAQSFRNALAILESDDEGNGTATAIYDKAETTVTTTISPLEKISLTNQLLTKTTQLQQFTATQVLEKITCTQQVLALLAQLGLMRPNNNASPTVDPANLFAYDGEGVTAKLRQQRNNAAIELLQQINSGAIASDALTAEQKLALSLYSGNGGGMVRTTGMKGSQFEYYTPKPVAAGMWNLLKECGFSGGAVLDPCAGTGIFSATAPANGVTIHAVELDATSGGINKAIFGGTTNHVDVSNFETIANSTDDEIYDAVITNVPFGDNKARGKNKKDDPRYQSESLEGYFILRSLDKLKPNGLAVFMSGTKFITGRSCEKVRMLASYKAEFMGAYRLPNKLFTSAGADVVTDVMVFKKHPKDAQTQIADLRETDPAKLRECRVIDDNFVNGRYFETDGIHFKLGTSTTAQDRYGREVEKLTSDASLTEIAQAMRKFGGSKIDWDMLGAEVGGSIVYRAGDTTVVNGQTMVFDGVDFAPVKNAGISEAKTLIEGMAQYVSAVQFLESGAEIQPLFDGYEACRSVGQYTTIPQWLRAPLQYTSSSSDFALMLTILAYEEVKELHAGEAGFDYLSQYPKLAAAIQGTTKTKYSTVLGWLPNATQEAAQSMHVTVYDRKTGQFTPFWRGQASAEVHIDATAFSPLQNYERLLYQQGHDYTQGLPLDDFKSVMPDVDLYTDTAWCLSADGTRVISANDYYSGTLMEFNARTQMDLSAITDEALKAKLIAQQNEVQNRIVKADAAGMTFDIRSPYTNPQQVLAFLQQFVSPHYRLKPIVDGDKNVLLNSAGEELVKFEYAPPAHEAAKTIQHYGKARLAVYLNTGSFSSGTKDEADNIAIRDELTRLIGDANLKFDAYIHTNKQFMQDMDARINTPETIRFKTAEGTGALHIDGMSDQIKPHQYQADYVRQQVRNMGGILAYDVGLGKTLTALATVKHLHNIGAKKKTLFVVPNTTLSNWHKEVKQAYTSMDDCLFVGLRADKSGRNTVKASNYAADLAQLTDTQYRKIYLTLEAFEKIPLRAVTLDDYIDVYLPEVEDIYAMYENTEKSKNAAEDAKVHLRADVVAKMDNAIPFLEAMGVDSLVMDEAHVFKNSRKGLLDAGGSIQFLSLPDTSSRGMNAQIKTWYIRGKNKPKMDGVLGLTATPVTNSPLEIYSMLVLVHGEERLQKMLGGVKSSSGFLEAFCDIQSKKFINIHNEEVDKQAFVGLKNAVLLRKIFGDIATVKTAQDADVADLVTLPDIEPFNQNIEMPFEIKMILKEAINTNKTAKLFVMKAKAKGLPVSKETALEASAFHFINKVSRAVLDKDMFDEVTRYSFTDKKTAQLVIDEFNAKAYKEERSRPSPFTPEDAVLGFKSKTNSDEEMVEICTIRVTAWLDKKQIVIDTDEYETQAKFLAIAEKHNLFTGVSMSAKVAALVTNINNERANPKAKGGKCKQLIFCDLLGMHKKIKLALTQFANIPADKIKIVNAVEIDDAGLMQEVQDGFNAEADENRYEIIIANKKAEVGINLQKGSQAVHHLTTGWTPDSLQQRDGRVARQGNYVDSIAIYHYHANGTFDEYKQQLVSVKSDWIMDLLRGTGERVSIEGGLSKEDMETLASFVGDADAMAKAKADMLVQKQASNRKATLSSIDGNGQVYKVSQTELKNFPKFGDYLLDKILTAFKQNRVLMAENAKLDKANSKERPDDKLIARIKMRIQTAQYLFDQQKVLIEECTGDYDALIKERVIYVSTSRGVDKVETSTYSFSKVYEKLEQSKDMKATQLYTEWADNVAQHEAIMMDAVKKSAQLGETVGLNQDDVQALFDNAALQQGDVVVRKGIVFVNRQDNDRPYYAVVESASSSAVKCYSHLSNNRMMIGASDFTDYCTVLKPDMTEYTKAIEALTEFERARLERNNWADDQAGDSIRTLCRDVSEGLGRAVRTIVKPSEYMLVDAPMPYLVVDSTDNSPLIQKVIASQLENGVLYDNEIVSVDDFTRMGELGTGEDFYHKRFATTFAFATAHGVEINRSNLSALGIYTYQINGDKFAREMLRNALNLGYTLTAWQKRMDETIVQENWPKYYMNVIGRYCVVVAQDVRDFLVSKGILGADLATAGVTGLIETALTEFGLMPTIRAFMEQQILKKEQQTVETIPPTIQAASNQTANIPITYRYMVGNTMGLFTARRNSDPKICDIRQTAKDLGVEVGWIDKYGKSRDTVVQRKVEQQGTVPINSWVMDQRLWDHLLKNHNQQLNNAGITAYEVKR